MFVTRRSLWTLVLLTAIVSSSTTLVLLEFIQPDPAIAQTSVDMSTLMFSANGRRDTDKNECYIFFDPAQRELWFYRDEKCEKHLRITELGQPLEDVKEDRK
ncbi:MAG: hypothetical protein Kow0074_20170 [Candidatus Zixiibacteriota bacterium]